MDTKTHTIQLTTQQLEALRAVLDSVLESDSATDRAFEAMAERLQLPDDEDGDASFDIWDALIDKVNAADDETPTE